MPIFDEAGNYAGITIGRVTSVHEEFTDTVLKEGVSIEDAVRTVSTTTADHCKLSGKGHIKEGFDADILLLDKDSLEIKYVFARGRMMMEDKKILAKGTFE